MVRLVSHVVGKRRRDDPVTDKSEVSRRKAAVVIVEPMVAPICAMLRTADQPHSKATLEPAKFGANNSIRPLLSESEKQGQLADLLNYSQSEKEEAGH